MCNLDKCKSMALEVQADLARESKRDAKGVSWERYQAVCDELEGADAMIEELQAKVAELASLNDKLNHSLAGTQLAAIKADAIHEAAKYGIYESGFQHVGEVAIDVKYLKEYADKLEAGEL